MQSTALKKNKKPAPNLVGTIRLDIADLVDSAFNVSQLLLACLQSFMYLFIYLFICLFIDLFDYLFI